MEDKELWHIADTESLTKSIDEYMEAKELLDIYESLNKKLEISKKAEKRLVYYTLILGFIIFFLSVIFVIPAILEWYFEINIFYSFLVGSFFGLLLIAVSRYLGRPWPPKLSINEHEFFKVVESLKDIETYQKENSDFSRSEAAKKLSKVERRIIKPQTMYQNPFWDALVKENVDSLYQFKSNFKERLRPNLIKGNDEDLKKTSFIIEKFAKYLYNPTISELKDLNKYMLEMNQYPPKESLLKTIFRHPYMIRLYVLICIIGCIIGCGYLAFYVGIKAGASIDTAYATAIGVSGTLTTAYLAYIISRKR